MFPAPSNNTTDGVPGGSVGGWRLHAQRLGNCRRLVRIFAHFSSSPRLTLLFPKHGRTTFYFFFYSLLFLFDAETRRRTEVLQAGVKKNITLIE